MFLQRQSTPRKLGLRLTFCEAQSQRLACVLHGAENATCISSVTPHGNPVKQLYLSRYGDSRPSGGAAQPVTLELLLSDVGGRIYLNCTFLGSVSDLLNKDLLG